MLAALLTRGDITLYFCGCSSPARVVSLNLTKASTEDNSGGQGMSSEVPTITGRLVLQSQSPERQTRSITLL